VNVRVVAIIIGVAVAASVGALALTLPQQNEAVQNNAGMLGNGKDTSDVITSMVEYHDGTSGFLARPDSMEKYPAIIMIHEFWGLNDNIKDMAKQMAAEGYVIMAVDLYNGEVATNSTRAGELASGLRNNPEPAIDNMKSAVSFLRKNDSVMSDRIASLGWCFGGGMSLQLALNENMAATGIYYGRLVTDKESLSVITWPVLGIFGSADTGIPVDQVNAFETALNEINVENEIYIYEGVGHAFANPSGQNYAPEETKDAWQKTVAFFDKHLK
jgi:carboxymethylenebutenolidase